MLKLTLPLYWKHADTQVFHEHVMPHLAAVLAHTLQRAPSGSPLEHARYRADESLVRACIESLAGVAPWLADYGHKVCSRKSPRSEGQSKLLMRVCWFG